MIYKRGNVYWYEFEFKGERIRESAKTGNKDVARQIEAGHRTSLAKGEVGIRDTVATPILKDFLQNDYRAYMEEKHKAKLNTVLFYDRGIKNLVSSEMAGLRLDEITNQHGMRYQAEKAHLSPSGINCGLRTLSVALRLAVEWGKLQVAPRVKMASGERRRERVLSVEEQDSYLAACPFPWRDIAATILTTAMRPGEVRGLTWDRVDFAERLITVSEGKSENAARCLPMQPVVYAAFLSRWEALGRPETGWVFPSPIKGKKGHLVQGYEGHRHALKVSGVVPFVPYTLRHTALTMLGTSGCDLFTLKTIAGHASIRMTQRYIHPQADSVRAAFARLNTPKIPHTVPAIASKSKKTKAA